MIEPLPLLKLDVNLSEEALHTLATRLNTTLWATGRGIMYIRNSGFSLDELCSRDSEVKKILVDIEKSIVDNFKNLYYVIYREIGKVEFSENPKGINSLLLDSSARHVRIPISGVSAINNTQLTIGSVYVVDSIGGIHFSASNATHLVLHLLPNEDKRKIWKLYV